MNRFPILLIDDSPSYCAELEQIARNERFRVTTFNNLEEGIDFLRKNHRIKAVILDDTCVLNPDQKPGTAKTNFIFHALKDLNDLKHEQDRQIPFCVNTSEIGDLRDDLSGLARVFVKHQDEKLMFQHLRKEISALTESIIEEEFGSVLDLMEEYFDREDQELMQALLINRDKTDSESLISNLTLVRRLEEKLFDVLSRKLLNRDPYTFENRHSSRTKSIIQHLHKEKLLPYELKELSFNIYSYSSKLGNHNSKDYKPGLYFVKSMIYGLLELYNLMKM
jgi:CheY-like chemotaxis protein